VSTPDLAFEELARKMILNGETTEKISSYTDLPSELIEELRKEQLPT